VRIIYPTFNGFKFPAKDIIKRKGVTFNKFIGSIGGKTNELLLLLSDLVIHKNNKSGLDL
jgi:hypothetical protein